MNGNPPVGGEGPRRESVVLESLPPHFGARAAMILDLAQSPFHRHFLERFLDYLGRPLGLPWWGVHLILYIGTVLAVFTFADVRAAYPGLGHWSLGLQLASEFLFTTFMLWHLRQARTEAFVVVASLGSGPERLQWLRRYLGPFHHGWHVPLGVQARTAGTRGVWLRPWHLAVLLLALYYGLVAYYALHPGALRPWSHAFPQILLLYTHSTKALMMVAVLAHFWWLAGMAQVATGAWSTALSPQRRAALLDTARQAALRLTVVTGCATGFWMFAYGLCFGVTWWAWLLSVGLLAVFLAQVVTLSGRVLNCFLWLPILVQSLTALLGVRKRTLAMCHPAAAWAIAAVAASPPLLNVLASLCVNPCVWSILL